MLSAQASLLGSSSAQSWALDVVNMRHRWTHIRDETFYTLGRPVYQLPANLDAYSSLNEDLNQVLWRKFYPLYEKVFSILEEHLNAEIFHLPMLALPGFHIFEYDSEKPSKQGGAHFDLSHMVLARHFNLCCDPECNLSFTLALELPVQGSGVDLFPSWYDGTSKESYEAIASSLTPTYVPYEIGGLYIFSGYRLHRIALNKSPHVNGRRITMQGHLFKCRNNWIIYW
jgi:hypothetical protein